MLSGRRDDKPTGAGCFSLKTDKSRSLAPLWMTAGVLFPSLLVSFAAS
jgi:hypothetical protein